MGQNKANFQIDLIYPEITHSVFPGAHSLRQILFSRELVHAYDFPYYFIKKHIEIASQVLL